MLGLGIMADYDGKNSAYFNLLDSGDNQLTDSNDLELLALE